MRMLQVFALVVSFTMVACVTDEGDDHKGRAALDEIVAEDGSELPDLVEDGSELADLVDAEGLPVLEHERAVTAVDRETWPALEQVSVQRR